MITEINLNIYYQASCYDGRESVLKLIAFKVTLKIYSPGKPGTEVDFSKGPL